MKMKRILAVLLGVVLCCSLAATAFETKTDPKYQVNTAARPSETFDSNQRSASMLSDDLQKAFRKNDLEKRTWKDTEGFTSNGISIEGFPEYYAGMYINSEGKLVVLLSDNYLNSGLSGLFLKQEKENRAKEEIMAMADSDNIIFGSAKYSYRELLNTMSVISNFVQDNLKKEAESQQKAEYRVVSYAIFASDNCITVWLNSTSDEARTWFRKNVSNAPYITFSDHIPNIEPTATVTPGMRI